ncbi:MAG TPA: AGE family epimerase/isomerase [bacterium]|nr:AGE family epimerase/isomerase [bacterium]HPN44380.1 AGE family epimerase/isomerase [bacterium]
MKAKFRDYARLYRDTLLNDVVPFWERHSPDREYGGYLTCLDRQGRVYDTDKFVWLQARQIWLFSRLYNDVEKKKAWLDMAALGIKFLLENGRSPEGDWYFSLTREGKPLIQPYNIFSDCFAAMALGQYSRASGESQAADLAVQTWRNILNRQTNPKGKYNKTIPGTRPLENFALPMILCNLSLELEHVLNVAVIDSAIDLCCERILKRFYRPDYKLVFENIQDDGSLSDSFEGRLINPGHGIEAMWFLMDVARRRNDRALAQQAAQIVLQILEYGWDREYGGIFYFLDAHGHPPQQLEWDQKLWWVHLETLVALVKGYALTGNQDLWQWYEKVHNYTWSHFPDPEYGEWWGYLNRRGEVLLPLKGGKWKGCFHVPRALWLCWRCFTELSEK